MIQIEGLSHWYAAHRALKDIDLNVQRGEIVAILGCNGAGKSTLMKILTTALLPSQGSVKVAGFDIFTHSFELKTQLGYLPETNPLYDDLTVHDSLFFAAKQRGLGGAKLRSAMDGIVSRCGLNAIMHKTVAQLSKGLRQRLGFAQAVIHEPAVLLLDEPSSGLDPLQIKQMRTMIREFGQNRTVLLSTHILQEVEALASRVLILHEGQLKLDKQRETLFGDLPPTLAGLQSIFEKHAS